MKIRLAWAAGAAILSCAPADAESIILRQAFSAEDRFHLANSADGTVTYLGALTDRYAGIAANR